MSDNVVDVSKKIEYWTLVYEVKGFRVKISSRGRLTIDDENCEKVRILSLCEAMKMTENIKIAFEKLSSV